MKPSPEQKEVLCDLYLAVPEPLDQLPFTSSFEVIVQGYRAEFSPVEKSEIWHALTYLRKRGDLPRKGRRTK